VEVSRLLREAGVTLRHPLEVAVFANEEGGKTGSRALSGEVTGLEWDIPTASGHTIGEGTLRIGGNPDRVEEVRREPGSVAAYVELHIEQGAVLERRGIPVGVVEGIVGIRRWNVQVEGEANHAGTTPMDARRDAMVAAARFVDAVYRTVGGMPGSPVATVGRVEVSPGRRTSSPAGCG
jgi:beta-ureidopropionase / N-carbamoyl-L-amino-acid hydrolase